MKTADIICKQKESIVNTWLERVREEIPLVNNYDKTAIQNSVPQLIDSIIAILTSANTQHLKVHSLEHGWQRSQHNAYSMKHIIQEYNLLRRVIFELLDEYPGILLPDDRNIIIDAVSYAIELSAEAFYNEKQNVQINARRLAEMKADQLKIEDKNREEFIQSIIHDLNSPLNNIKACIEMLERDLEVNEAKKVLNILRASSHQAELLIEDFLDVGTVGSDKEFPLKKEKVNILNELEHQIKIYRISNRRDIVLDAPEKEIIAEVDVSLVRRAFNNLMNNALKHGLPSKPISVSCSRQDGMLAITVFNESKEIPESIRSSIFNRYYKASGSSKGWGIGLAFVKKVAEAHHGNVYVESNKSGTTFTMEIPQHGNGSSAA